MAEKKNSSELQKNDFIEIEFVGKLKDEDEVFDSNIKKEIEKIPNIDPKSVEKMAKPFIYCLGQGMFLQGVDENLVGKKMGKHTIDLDCENAFGKRDPKSIQRIPMNVFKQHNVNPVQGATMNFDGKMGKILSVSGGRVLVDFNHPIAGKDVIYTIDVKRKVEDLEEKIKAFIEFIFKKELDYDLDKEKKTITLKVEPQLKQMTEMFKDKFKELFELDLKVVEK